ncbi:MAG: ytcQ 2, partial [Paenibacillaceae bacterium]|nr:ytcQ 2 [Paenibacillaceae bacterium]
MKQGYFPNRFKLLQVIGAGALAAALTAGCAGGGSKDGTAAASNGTQAPVGTQSASKDPVTVKLLIPYWNAEAPAADSEAIKKLQAHTNTKLDIAWVPAASYTDKLNALIASQNLPQVVYVLVGANKQSGLVNAFRSGMFWEIGPYLKDYPNLSKIDPKQLAESSIDGKIYGIYKSFPQARDGIIYRKDWLDALNLKAPSTLDELNKVLEAFAQQDPDKNGKKDTFGISSSSDVGGFNNYVVFNGGPNQWGVENGKLVPAFLTEAYKKTLSQYKHFYEAGVINQDFPSVKSAFDLINKGKAGAYIGPLDDIQTRFADLTKAYPEAQLDVISLIEGPNGARVPTRGVFPPQFLFPKTSIKSEAELTQVLGSMDKLADPEIQNLLKWGIEGVHYKVQNGTAERTDAQKYTQDVSQLDFLQYTDYSGATPGTLAPVVEKALKM